MLLNDIKRDKVAAIVMESSIGSDIAPLKRCNNTVEALNNARHHKITKPLAE